EGALEYRALEDKLVPLQHPVGEDYGWECARLAASSEGGGSLVPAFCRAYIKETGKEVIAIHAAKGSTALGEWQKGTHRFKYMSDKINAGIKKAKERGEVEHIYYVWLQGESDSILGTSEDEYLESLIRYKNTLKKEFGIEKFGIIKVGYFFCTSQWHTNVSTYEEKKKNDETIMRAQERAVETDSDFVMLTRVCSQLSMQKEYINPKASGHYNNAAMEIIGESAGKTLAKL
ncbi:MAG: hypothetical protein IJW60_00800, partial [Clostridia bacterium]|nr:hypothetical protein [Clostridia bacterium]